ncbi:pentatricopeptide repeat-containing protein at1g74630 [Phtheirospermum japonicum]|uniref:Pentatricopeptide repeat-containing protein at1g74630 n=1 Tax=Phtheirospermum japonicum TaxID=374723 RepID=A0A830AWM7_9LAMI|nr:pentatricopeptide repeat-containing protein at1g74630 [Phtheirospermum japonicum]
MKSAEQFCVSFLNNCGTLRSLQQFQARATKTGLDSNPLVAGKLLLHCAVHLSDGLDYARRLLLRTPNPDPFMYNGLIRGFSDSDSPQSSISTFSLMLMNLDSHVDSFSLAFTLKSAANMRCLRTGVQLHCQALTRGLDKHLFVGTTLISMYAECGCSNFAARVFDEMPEPNIVTWNALVTAFFRSGDVKRAERVFNLMPAKNLASYNLMLAGYTKLGELRFARKVFKEMPTRDEVSWSTMIAGLAQHGCFDEALGYFRELHRVGMRPNEVSLTGMLSACAHSGALECAKILHGFIGKVGLLWITPVNNALIDTYSKCGSVDMARLVFETMVGEKSIVSWTSMIVGLAMQGYGEDALHLFNEMEKSGMNPDGISFVAILYACSHAGLVEEGCQVFDKMTRVYGIKPEIEHYGCMVDLFGRAGHLLKAYDFITRMPIQPNAVIWRTLLGACSFYGNLNLAEEVKKRLSELDPNNSGDHVLLSNIYAVSGKWKDVETVRRSMAELNLIKSPGWSMIEVNKVMYTFVAGPKQDDVTKEAYEKLKEIMLRVRVEGGYVPEVNNVLHDIEEEEKEDAIIAHSEKLAVAFGMGRLAKGGVLRIVKNLRVCKDCHNVMKLISKVYGLEIMLRDRSRFHAFKNGSCSCRDYW